MGLFNFPELVMTETSAPAKPRNWKKGAAHAKHKLHQKTMRLAFQLYNNYLIREYLGAEKAQQLNVLLKEYPAAARLHFKTFTVCPTCYTALKGRKPRKAYKEYSHFNCNICNKLSFISPTKPFAFGSNQNIKIHHSTSLQEAQEYVTSNFPELFL